MNNPQSEHSQDVDNSYNLEWCIKVTTDPNKITNNDLEVLKGMIGSSDEIIRSQAIIAIGAVCKSGISIDKVTIAKIQMLALNDDSAHVRCSVMLTLPDLPISLNIFSALL